MNGWGGRRSGSLGVTFGRHLHTHQCRQGGWVHVVIIGNGVAGMEAALSLRKRDDQVRITIVSEESDNFFSRTALMYVLSGQMSHRDIEPLERGTYERLGFTRVRARAVGVDTAAKQVQLAAGACSACPTTSCSSLAARGRVPPRSGRATTIWRVSGTSSPFRISPGSNRRFTSARATIGPPHELEPTSPTPPRTVRTSLRTAAASATGHQGPEVPW